MNFQNGSARAMLARWEECFGHTFEANSIELFRAFPETLSKKAKSWRCTTTCPCSRAAAAAVLALPATTPGTYTYRFWKPSLCLTSFFKLMNIPIWYTRARVNCNGDVCRARGRTVTTCHCLGTPCLAPTPPPPLASARLPQRAAWATLTRTTRLQILAMTPSQALHFLRQPSSRISWCLELGTTMSGDEG